MDKLIIGLVGEKRAGKGLVYTIIQSMLLECPSANPGDTLWGYYRFSQILGEILNPLKNTAPIYDRKILQALPMALELVFGRDVLTPEMIHRIQDDPHRIIIVDGIRLRENAEALRELPDTLLIYVTAPLGVRWRRARANPEKPDEKDISLEEFRLQELARVERDIPIVGQTADFRIDNNRSIKHLSNLVRTALGHHIDRFTSSL